MLVPGMREVLELRIISLATAETYFVRGLQIKRLELVFFPKSQLSFFYFLFVFLFVPCVLTIRQTPKRCVVIEIQIYGRCVTSTVVGSEKGIQWLMPGSRFV